MITTAIAEVLAAGNAAPDDRLASGPHHRVAVASGGSADRRHRSPPIVHGIVAPARVLRRSGEAAPNDELGARPNSHAEKTWRRRIGRRHRSPAIVRGIVARTGVDLLSARSPDDHFIAGPNCDWIVSR